ncbi:MAG: 4-(cytidine 5'-diphospho)-2-C-methyl-D-erythritol kinase [Pseudomonadota bacterium]
MRLLSPAKINLFLQVVGKRPDGYHDLFTLMCPVGLYDTVTITFTGSGINAFCTDPCVPDNESNLAVKAAKLFLDQGGGRGRENPEGIDILIEKQIPVGAGLGGGSSNAAAVLLGLNRYFGSPFQKNQLLEMGLSIGADVPFFIFGKPALARGVGEKLKRYHGLSPYPVVLVFPGFSVSTAGVFRDLNLGLTKCERKIKDNSFIRQRFKAERHLCNDLETVTASRYKEVNEAKAALLQQGAIGSLMTGSGPTVFGLFSGKKKAESAAGALSKPGGWKVFCADMIV